MPYAGGDTLEITYDHEVIGNGSLRLKSNEDGTVDLGGFRSNDDANSITGDGQLINQINRVRASFEAPPVAWNMIGEDDLAKLVQLAASPIDADWTITLISGKIYGGKGRPVGDLTGATNTSLITLKIAFSELKPLS